MVERASRTLWTDIRQRRATIAAELLANRILDRALRAAHQRLPLREPYDRMDVRSRCELKERPSVGGNVALGKAYRGVPLFLIRHPLSSL